MAKAKIYTIPKNIVDTDVIYSEHKTTAWNWLVLSNSQAWGDEIHFECLDYRCFGIFYTDGTQILDPYYADEYGAPPFYALEHHEGIGIVPVDYWSTRGGFTCRLRVPGEIKHDENFFYIGEIKIAVFDSDIEEIIPIKQKKVERYKKIIRREVFEYYNDEIEYDGLHIVV